jgi:hypothetical protein
MPASAQAPPKASEIDKGASITVVYSLTNSHETISDADFVSISADWLVVSGNKGKRLFIPVKNILRMDVRK